jgi:hypothetical protein
MEILIIPNRLDLVGWVFVYEKILNPLLILRY